MNEVRLMMNVERMRVRMPMFLWMVSQSVSEPIATEMAALYALYMP